MREILHIYRRVSTKDQSTQYSLNDQLNYGIKKSKDLGFEYKDWCEGGVSGSSENIEDRDVLTDLYSEIQLGKIHHLYVFDLSRLSRNPMVSSQLRRELEKNNVKLYTNESQINFKNDEEILMYDFFSSINHFFVRVQKKKSMVGKVSHFKKGGWRGGTPPFGYTSEKIDGVKSLVIDSNQSLWVRKIFEWFVNDISTIEIGKRLDKNGVKPPRTTFWNITTIGKMLRSELYIGKDRMIDKISNPNKPRTLFYQDERLRIIDDLTFHKVQEKLDLILKQKNQLTKVIHDEVLLRGLLFCGKCGEMYSSRVKHSKNEYYYYCRSKENNWRKVDESKKVDCSVRKSINIKNTDELVWNTLIEILGDSHILKEEIKNQVLSIKEGEDEEKLQKLVESKRKKRYVEGKISELESREKENREWYIIGDIDKEEHETNKTLIQKKKSERFLELENLNMEISTLENQKRWIDWLGKHQEWVSNMKSEYSIEERKNIINEYIQKILVFFDKEKNQHSLRIELKLPIVGDRYEKKDGGGYKILNGNTITETQVLPKKKGRKPLLNPTEKGGFEIIPPIKNNQSRWSNFYMKNISRPEECYC